MELLHGSYSCQRFKRTGRKLATVKGQEVLERIQCEAHVEIFKLKAAWLPLSGWSHLGRRNCLL